MNVTRTPFYWASLSVLLFTYNKVSIDRVGEFLGKEDRQNYVKKDKKKKGKWGKMFVNFLDGSISIKNGTFNWPQQKSQKPEAKDEAKDKKYKKKTLQDINLKVLNPVHN